MENMREYWAREAEMMRDKSAVLGQDALKKIENLGGQSIMNEAEFSVPPIGIYYFNSTGHYVGFEKTNKPAYLVLRAVTDKNGKIIGDIYTFNDPITDTQAINYNYNKPPKVFNLIRFVYGYSDEGINKMMELSNVKKGRSILSIAKASVGGELDFAVWHFSKTIEKVQPGYWDPNTEILKDKGPLFVFPNSTIVYNLLDAGNWLWGNAMRRMGFTLNNTLEYAKTYDRHDTTADLRAISAGWAAAPK